jgi:magnesium transporter
MRVLETIDDSLLDSLRVGDEYFRLDLSGPSSEDVERLAQRFGWHPLAVEDLVHFGQRPKMDGYGDYMLLVFYGARQGDEGAAELTEVHLVVSGSYIVTVRHAHCHELDELRRRVKAKPNVTEQYIVYSVLDALTDTFFPVLAAIDDEIDQLEDDSRNYFRDVYDHLIRISDLIDSYRDLLTGAMDVYLSTVSNRLNVVMKQLTIMATIFFRSPR